ncbi:type I polyketide synthase [Photobacterium chitinilyticum]|uniref:SDR family NAD(P)-dependent oxidoreductase n=1 Tax=Photobacterium chitinilyticum TaxID=2485123 RepID=A0A3S3S1F9_9GAMM|nr:type I polyketide synthase [Photobacterium chitinilyticum]RWX55666.1 SDR family NAD(P)-dependent oxidoreductase [Photobacterium chitinilyticum]
MNNSDAIAVIGFAARVPGAETAEEFWHNVKDGKCAIETVKEAVSSTSPHYVDKTFPLKEATCFDAAHFGISPAEAKMMDPQQRVFLETSWHALEHAGYGQSDDALNTGVFACAGFNDYVTKHVKPHSYHQGGAEYFRMLVNSDKDFIATKTAYYLNLKGPAVCVQSACSSGLLAVHLAVQSLLQGESDMALAGGAAVCLDLESGYAAEPGGPMSPTGRVAPFDVTADGIIGGNGTAAVILKRLDDAIESGDTIHAVIHATAANNDGFDKAGLAAPSVKGQNSVLAEALALSGLSADDIRYIETHGTGTHLGDPIEFESIRHIYGEASQACYLGSSKANIGHLNTVSGVIGLIKAIFTVRERQIAPLCHFSQPNPELPLEGSRFHFNQHCIPWAEDQKVPFAAVSSFGIGGTNVHAIISGPPVLRTQEPAKHERPHVLCWSANTEQQANLQRRSLAQCLRQSPDSLADAEYTLWAGRTHLAQRQASVLNSQQDAAQWLTGESVLRSVRTEKHQRRDAVFLFPGQGSQFAGMGNSLYLHESSFRERIDTAALYLQPLLGYDIRTVMFGNDEEALRATLNTQLCLFIVEYGVAELLIEKGVQPVAMLGHSIGEYVAAAIAGVMSFEEALQLVYERGSLVSALPGAAMLSVSCSPQELSSLLSSKLSVAVINRSDRCVISGLPTDIEALAAQLSARQIDSVRLNVSHGFHSHLLDPVLESFSQCCEKIQFKTPRIPVFSNVTGKLHDPDLALSAEYWVRHLRETVRFSDNIQSMANQYPEAQAIEVGPGCVLSRLVRSQCTEMNIETAQTFSSYLQQDEDWLTCLARLWVEGWDISPTQVESGQRIPLPLYPFVRQEHILPLATTLTEADSGQEILPESEWVQTTKWSPVPLWRVPAETASDVLKNALCFLPCHESVVEGICVKPAEDFEKVEQGFQINPSQPEHFSALFEDLGQRLDDCLNIVFAWPMQKEAQQFEQGKTLGYDALVYLSRELIKRKWQGHLTVVIPALHTVIGCEPVNPLGALAIGIARNLSLEYPSITVNTIEFEKSLNWQIITKLVPSEAVKTLDLPYVAERFGRLWHKEWTSVPLDKKVETSPQLDDTSAQEKKAVLLLGGTGGIGLQLARRFVGKTEHLILTGFSSYTELEKRPAFVSLKARLEQSQTTLSYYQVDLGDVDALEKLFASIETEHDSVDSAWLLTGRYINQDLGLLDPLNTDSNVHCKARAAWHVKERLCRLSCRSLVLFSSITSEISGVGCADYGAANMFLNALAEGQSESPLIQTIAWDAWLPAGALGESLESSEGLFQESLLGAIGIEQGVAIMGDLMRLGLPYSLVSCLGLEKRQAIITQVLAEERADVSTFVLKEDSGAQSDLERCLCLFFAESLGLTSVNVMDDFLQAGGDSLAAVRMLSKLRSIYKTEMGLADFIRHRTPRQLAVQLADTAQAERISSLYLKLNQMNSEERLGLSQSIEQKKSQSQEVASV